jgi:hypothetical protein
LDAPKEAREKFAAVCADLGVVDGRVPVLQADLNGQMVDVVDRIQVGADILRHLIDAACNASDASGRNGRFQAK